MKVIRFVTGNRNKLLEVKGILQSDGSNLVIESVEGDLEEYQGGDAEEICRKKCIEAIKMFGCPVLVDDTSLCFDAMGGLPGPYVKWFQQAVGATGLHRMLAGSDDKGCSAVCIIGYAETVDTVVMFKGVTRGKVVSPRGPDTFGWDCCFQPDGLLQTYAEMSGQQKNVISHRYRALLQLRDYLTTLTPSQSYEHEQQTLSTS